MKLTNKELGDAIGVSPSMASRIRNGRRLPSVKVMEELSKQYTVPISTLTKAHTRGTACFSKVVKIAIGG